MHNKIFNFVAGCATGSTSFIAALAEDYEHRDSDELEYLILLLRINDQPHWKTLQTSAKTIASIALSNKDNETFQAYALGYEGEVSTLTQDGEIAFEQIPDAGLENPDPYGQVLRIVKIANSLYSCGDTGQVYKRHADGWRHMDSGLLQQRLFENLPKNINDLTEFAQLGKTVITNNRNIVSIAGSFEKGMYAVGSDGLLARFDGLQWKIHEKITAAHLNFITIDQDDTVTIVGSDATIIRGRENDFNVVSQRTIETSFYRTVEFQNKTIISSEEGLYTFDGKSITRLRAPRNIDVNSAQFVEVIDNILWAATPKSIIRFDGNNWAQYQIPTDICL